MTEIKADEVSEKRENVRRVAVSCYDLRVRLWWRSNYVVSTLGANL
jgi:hypothetical protein